MTPSVTDPVVPAVDSTGEQMPLTSRASVALVAAALAGSLSLAAHSPAKAVRAGDYIVAGPGGCTAAFVLEDGDGQRYLATAGHCVEVTGAPTAPRAGEHIWTDLSSAPVVFDRGGTAIGKATYAVEIRDSDEDFALIRVDDDVRAIPDVPGIGVPRSIANSISTGDPVRLFGHGQIVSDLAPNRDGLVLGTTSTRAMVAIPVSPGDSGGPVVGEDGTAFGVVAGVGGGVPVTTDTALASNGTRVPRLDAALARVATVTGLELMLATD